MGRSEPGATEANIGGGQVGTSVDRSEHRGGQVGTVRPERSSLSRGSGQRLEALGRRAFGVGIVVAMQNPMDLDYRALSNAGLWCVGRLQTDADRSRVVEGLASAAGQGGYAAAELTSVLKQLEPRWFLMRDAHAKGGRGS